MSIRQSLLESKAASYNDPLYEGVHKGADLKLRRTAFLCHSHRDQSLVRGLIVLLKEEGVDLYIDWKDHTMPETPDGVTARKIQDKIESCDIFLFLASANSKASRWCPWEIGYADSSEKRIYIIPTSNYQGDYGNEYLQLYPRIDEGIDEFKHKVVALYEAGETRGSLLKASTL